MNTLPARGEEFRDDLRRLATPPAPVETPRSGNAGSRRLLSAAELASLTELNDARSLAAVSLTVGIIAAAVAIPVAIHNADDDDAPSGS